MVGEKRGEPRRDLTIDAMITDLDRNPIVACKTFDVSKSGARLVLKEANDVPDEFLLLLTQDGVVHRRCRVAWRNELELGIKFVQTRDEHRR